MSYGAASELSQNRNMDTVEMRVATPDDADAVEDYHDRCFRKTYSAQLLAGEFEAPCREGTKQQLRDWFQPDSEFETRVAVVADTPIGRIGCAICYDWLFPEVLRQLSANGAELLVRVSAYMDPWGATEPMSWWTIINRARAIENIAYVVAANQGASLRHYPPYSWPGGSQVVDFDGRLLADASPGPGERIVVAPIDVSAVRHERQTRIGHQMLAHLRTEAYPVYGAGRYPPRTGHDAPLSYEENVQRIEQAKQRLK